MNDKVQLKHGSSSLQVNIQQPESLISIRQDADYTQTVRECTSILLSHRQDVCINLCSSTDAHSHYYAAHCNRIESGSSLHCSSLPGQRWQQICDADCFLINIINPDLPRLNLFPGKLCTGYKLTGEKKLQEKSIVFYWS